MPARKKQEAPASAPASGKKGGAGGQDRAPMESQKQKPKKKVSRAGSNELPRT